MHAFIFVKILPTSHSFKYERGKKKAGKDRDKKEKLFIKYQPDVRIGKASYSNELSVSLQYFSFSVFLFLFTLNDQIETNCNQFQQYLS